MVNIYFIIESNSKGMYACEKNSNALKWMGFANVFIKCNLFDKYVKCGSEKICHEMVTFVCD